MRHNNFERDIPIRERLAKIGYRYIANSMTKNIGRIWIDTPDKNEKHLFITPFVTSLL